MTPDQRKRFFSIIREMMVVMYINPTFNDARIAAMMKNLEDLEKEIEGKGDDAEKNQM